MDKQNLLFVLLKDLRQTLEALVHTALVAKEAATGEESKAENKYDTRGLEASYLAGAQAKRAEDLREAVYKLQKLPLRDFQKSEAIALTAIVRVLIDGETSKTFFLLPSAGGFKVQAEGTFFHVITPESPVGRVLIGKKINDSAQVKINGKEFDYEIVDFC